MGTRSGITSFYASMPGKYSGPSSLYRRMTDCGRVGRWSMRKKAWDFGRPGLSLRYGQPCGKWSDLRHGEVTAGGPAGNVASISTHCRATANVVLPNIRRFGV